MSLFKDKIATLLAEHEEFLARKNNPMKGGNGIITRYEHPVLTAAHTPVFSSSLRLSYAGKPPAPSPEQAGKAAPGRDPGEGRWSLEEDVH